MIYDSLKFNHCSLIALGNLNTNMIFIKYAVIMQQVCSLWCEKIRIDDMGATEPPIKNINLRRTEMF